MNDLLAQLYTSSGQWYLQSGNKDKNSTELANQYFSKALNVHEEMLRLLVSDTADGIMGDDEDLDSTGAILAQHGITLGGETTTNHTEVSTAEKAAMAKTHLKLLKLAYQRLGYWPKSYSEYNNLIHKTMETFSQDMKNVQGPDKWQVKNFGGGKSESTEGAFEKTGTWQLVEGY